jgi:hypothetical protein
MNKNEIRVIRIKADFINVPFLYKLMIFYTATPSKKQEAVLISICNLQSQRQISCCRGIQHPGSFSIHSSRFFSRSIVHSVALHL